MKSSGRQIIFAPADVASFVSERALRRFSSGLPVTRI